MGDGTCVWTSGIAPVMGDDMSGGEDVLGDEAATRCEGASSAPTDSGRHRACKPEAPRVLKVLTALVLRVTRPPPPTLDALGGGVPLSGEGDEPSAFAAPATSN